MLRVIAKRLVLFLFPCVIGGCASAGRAVTFQSYEPGSVISLVPIDNPNGATVENLSNPVTLEPGKFEGKAVKISANGKSPQFWFPPDDAGRNLEIKVKELGTCDVIDGNRNRPTRLLLKAYQALSTHDFNLARELSSKAADLDPTMAGPHIISGLTFFQEGDKEKARIAFTKAQALDPEDQEIGQLLRMVQ